MARNKRTENDKRDALKRNKKVIALFFALVSFFSAYALIVPANSGVVGQAFRSVTLNVFGMASYFLPLLFLRYFVACVKQSADSNGKFYFTWSVVFIVCAAVLFEAMHFMFMSNVSGGWIGTKIYPFFKKFLGIEFGFAVIMLIFFFSLVKILKVSAVFYARGFLKSLKESLIKPKEEKLQNVVRKNGAEELTAQQKSSTKISKSELLMPNIINRCEKEDSKSDSMRTFSDIKKVDSKSFDYKLPPIDLLDSDSVANFETNKNDFFERAELLRNTLADFGVNAEVKDIIPGPVVTRYDLVLARGTRIQSVSSIIDNISLVMRTASIRVIPIPEKAAVGIEVPNPSSVTVGLRGILGSSTFKNSKSLITLALGKTTDGLGYIANLASMPHLLIAGATGSGKSVGIHAIILSILYKARPDEVKFMLIDPKRVEMPIYKDIPHLYNPCVCASEADIITVPKEVAVALRKLVVVMDDRYTKFAKQMVRNIEEYNSKMAEIGGEKEFYIVVVIDELADLMLVVQKEIEDSIQRLAQMARAVGIHLILATQRPSVNVITGIIKANFPARLSFQTTSKVDSRVVLDMLGAECLIGKGDMLFLPPGEAKPVRLQGAYVSLREAGRIVSFINSQKFPRIYEPIVAEAERKEGFSANEEKRTRDLIPALKLINERRRISQDLLKANFGGSARATNILSILETKGFITKPEGTNRWQINYDKIENYLKERSEKD